MKRVYHPRLNSWQDVPDDKVDAWADAGWLKKKPKHVDDSDAPGVGQHPGIASVPVLTSTAPVTTTLTDGTTTTKTAFGATARTTT